MSSTTSKILPREYIANLHTLIVKQALGQRVVDGFKKLHNKLLDLKEVTEIFLKLPGEELEEIPEYHKADILFCFMFASQIDWLTKNNARHVMADTTYCRNKYELKLSVFSILTNKDERGLSFIYTITRQETEAVLTLCLEHFKNKVPSSKTLSETMFCMTDMAPVFYGPFQMYFLLIFPINGANGMLIRHTKQRLNNIYLSNTRQSFPGL